MADLGGIPEDALTAALRTHYELEVASVGLLEGGEDANARVYRVDTGRERYVVKVRAATGPNDAAATVPRYLYDSGVSHVVAPLRSTTGSLSQQEGGFSLLVYPFIEGRTGVEAGLSERHRRALGALVKHLHTSSLPPNLMETLTAEMYRPSEIDVVRQIDRFVSERDFPDRLAQEVAAFWKSHRTEIRTLTRRTEELGQQLERLSLPLVVCHADLHMWNVVIDDAGGIWVIDWDGVIRAPKERDLMFFVGGIGADLIKTHETAWFFAGYGNTPVDPLALSYYRYAWAVQDIGQFGESIFLTRALAEESRSAAASLLRRLFDPGEIVELAFASDGPSRR